MVTVASPGWSVSCTTGSGIDGAILNVTRFRKYRGRAFEMRSHGDHDGRRFPSSDAAFAFALEHGYTMPFRTAWCRACRVRHTFLGKPSGWCDVRREFV